MTETAIKEQVYGFQGRLRAEFPSQVIVDPTEVCNLECIHCAHPTFKQSEYYSAMKMDVELNRKMIDEVRDHGQGITQYVRYTSSGEPLLHSKIYEMLQYATANCGTMVSLTTNGTLLNQKNIDRILDAGVDVIDISIDAFTPETYARVRVKGDLAVTRANVLRLIHSCRLRKAHTKVVVSFIEQPQNAHESKDFEEFWNNNGADYVIIRRLHSNAGALKNVATLLWEKNDQSQQERTPCVYPWERIVLNPRGHLSFCPADWTHGSTVIDYRTTTIRETWQGEFYRGLRKAHLTNDYTNRQFCGQCPDWANTRWPFEGRAFASMMEEFKANE